MKIIAGFDQIGSEVKVNSRSTVSTQFPCMYVSLYVICIHFNLLLQVIKAKEKVYLNDGSYKAYSSSKGRDREKEREKEIIERK